MQPYNISIQPVAREDIAEIYHYIALDSPSTALKVIDSILDKIDTLSEFPERCSLSK